MKSIKSSYEVAKAANDAKALSVAAQSLKNMLVRGGIPDRWQEGFEALRKDLAPDYNPTAPIASQKPAATPAAAGTTPVHEIANVFLLFSSRRGHIHGEIIHG